ncbi:MAG: AAA family ATPase [Candidatus Magasanikbacteria bacterium]
MFQIDYTYIGPIFAFAVILVFWAVKNKKIGMPKFGGGGGTPFLSMYATDFTAMAQQDRLDPVVGREEEVRKLAQILSRREKNNAILIGPPGVGKTAIVEALAERIVSHNVPDELWNKRVLALDVATLLSGTKYRGEFEERAKKIVQEITSSSRTIILFIDEVHAVVQSHGTEGAVNFSDILKPALARGDLQMVGATTTDEYEKYIKTDASLERRFQTVEVSEPTEEQTITILKGVQEKYRDYHKVEFTDGAIETAVRLSNELVKNRKLPDKALDALDEAGAMVKVSHIHNSIPLVLYQAAVARHPEAAEIWKKIQDLDKSALAKSVDEREKLENTLAQMGVITVDSADVEKVIRDWRE